MTAFQGPGGSGHIPTTEKLGGLAIKQFKPADLETSFINRNIFAETQSALTMTEVFGSDLMGFSSGGYVWAGEATANILVPLANLVGSLYRGTIQYGQLPNVVSGGLSLKDLIEIASST